MPPGTPAAIEALWLKRFTADKSDGKSVGKYPFMTWVNRYLGSMQGTFAPSTMKMLDRLYRHMYRELKSLEANDMITSTNPLHITMNDIGIIVNHYRNKGLKNVSIEHDFCALNNLLLFVGNPAFSMFKMRHPGMFPSVARPRHPPMEKETMDTIVTKAKTIDNNDWKRLRVYSIVLFAIGTGSRLK